MGTVLALLFIAVSAATGVLVGTRPTVIDGRAIAAELARQATDRELTIECDPRIRIGVNGAAFACTISKLGERARLEYTMGRDGSYRLTAP